MEIVESPIPADEPNLIYKLQAKKKLFEEGAFAERGYNLIATSSKYGLVFVGLPTAAIRAYYMRDIINADCSTPPYRDLPLPHPPAQLAVSCDREHLAVVCGPRLVLYRIQQMAQETFNAHPYLISQTPSFHATSLQWNPCVAETLALVGADGSLVVGHLQGGEYPFKSIQANARCICWSPKGKQLVSGNADGSLAQYKPDLTRVRTVPAPVPSSGAQLDTLAVHWLSNYQFAVVYRNAADDSRPFVTIVNTPKAGAPVCINYEDVCYSMGTSRPWYYYLHSIAQWGLLIAASSNSVEVATMATTDNVNWQQWCQTEEAKPELPLAEKKTDSYPVGVAFDTSAVHQIPWGENETLPHMPTLLVLSHTGLLVAFNVINLRPGAPQLCAPPDGLVLPQSQLVTPVEVQQAPPTAAAAPAPAPPPAPTPAASQPSGLFAPSTIAEPQSQTNSFNQASSFGGLVHQQQQQVNISVASAAQPQAKTITTPSAVAKPPEAKENSTTEQQSKSAELRAERREEVRLAAARANEDMRAMLLQEVNTFQGELHQFLTRSRQTEVKLDMTPVVELNAKLQHLNAAQIQKDCSTDSLNEAVTELKLDLVKAFALLAEARGQAGSGDVSPDKVEPLYARRVESARRRARALRTQLLAAQAALQRRWGELYSERRGRLAPALDEVYQPLVRQQEILNRQSALLKTLTATLQETRTVAGSSIIKSFSKDPLSKLTKNILNMSIEHKEPPATKGLTPQKLEVLRDLLSNHKTVRIKPVNMEVQHHIANMQQTHDRLVEEMRQLKLKKEQVSQRIKSEEKVPPVKVENTVIKQEPKEAVTKTTDTTKSAPVTQPNAVAKPKTTAKLPAPQAVIMEGPPPSQLQNTKWVKDLPDPQGNVVNWVQQAPATKGNVLNWVNEPSKGNAPIPTKPPASQANVLNWAQGLKPNESNGKSVTITPGNIANVARILFTEGETETTPAPSTTKSPEVQKGDSGSVLVSLLQKKTDVTAKDKDSASTFFGQKICSPSTTAAVSSSSSPFGASSLASTTKPAFSGTPAFTGTSIFGGKDSKPFSFGQSKASPDNTSNNEKFTEDIKKSSEMGDKLSESSNKETAQLTSKSEKDTKNDEKKTESKPSILGDLKSGQPEKKSDLETKITTLFGGKPAAKSQEIATTKPQEVAAKSEVPVAVPTQPAVDKSKFDASKTFSFVGTGTTVTTSAGSIFGAPSTNGAKAGTIFGGVAVSESTTPASVPASSAGASPGSIFSPATPALATAALPSIFGSAAAPPSTTAASPASAPAPPPAASPAASSAAPLAAPAPGAGNLFAASAAAAAALAAANASADTGSAGKPTSPTAPLPSAASVFGAAQPAVTTAGAPSIFAGAPANTSIFGSPTTASVFGAPAAAAPSPTSVFGTPAPASPAPSPASASSVFGTPAPAAPQQSGMFGSSTASSSVFGTPPAQSSQSIFGATTASSVFGAASPPAAAAPASMFGANEAANLFGAASIGGASQQQTGSVFGSSTGSVFGGGSVFGAKPAAFGQSAQSNQSSPSAIFGGAAAFGQKPAGSMFGGSATFGSSFSSPTTQASSIFGGGGGSGGGSTFGASPPAFGAPAQSSVFGTPDQNKTSSVFGSPQQNASAFGGGSLFGAKPAFGQSSPSFGGSAFSGFSSGSVGQSGFGAPASFGSKSPGGGFGGGAVFGGSPAFGAPAFGGGSPSKVFGGSSPGFGAPMQQSSTFENLAGQNTLSFGNLAQQGSQHQPPAFNTSPSFSGWRG